jgi:FkbM family methyltransferase
VGRRFYKVQFWEMKLLIYLRENAFFNLVVRNIIRILLTASLKLQIVATRFRIFGKTSLEIEGIKFKCLCRADDFMANGIYYGIESEANEFRLVKKIAQNANHFIEVGSYTGIFSIFASLCNPQIKVFCFEPHPRNYQRVLTNISLNKITNIKAQPVAMGNAREKVMFTFPSQAPLSAIGSVNQNFSQGFHNAAHAEVEVEQFPLTELLNGIAIRSNDFIKIDVEYYELNVLRGALEILDTKKPLIMVEIILSERLFFYRPEMKGQIDEQHAMEVESLLGTYGYHPYHILKDGVYRTDSVINSPDTRNYLFAPKKNDQRFVPFENLTEFFS